MIINKTLTCLMVVLSGVLTASANLTVNVNFWSASGHPEGINATMDGTAWSSAAAPASYTGNTWNDMQAPGDWYVLKDSEGNDTSARLDTTSMIARGWGADAGLEALKGYRYHDANDQHYELSGLGANTEWDIYILSHGVIPPDEGSVWTVGSEVKTAVWTSTSRDLAEWQEGANYVKFSSVTADNAGIIDLEVDIFGTGPNSTSVINGMQLVAVPEPTVAVLAGVFSVLVYCRKRFFF